MIPLDFICNSLTILLIGSDTTKCEMVADALIKYGYSVKIAADRDSGSKILNDTDVCMTFNLDYSVFSTENGVHGFDPHEIFDIISSLGGTYKFRELPRVKKNSSTIARNVFESSKDAMLILDNDVTLRDISERSHAEQEMLLRYSIEQTISRISLSFLNYADFDIVVRDVLKDLGLFTISKKAVIYKYIKDDDIIKAEYRWSINQNDSDEKVEQYSSDSFPYSIDILKNNEIIMIRNIAGSECLCKADCEYFCNHQIFSVLILPIYIKNILVGFVELDNADALMEWPDSINDLLQILSRVLSGAFERRNIELDLQKCNSELQTSEQQLRAINFQLNSSEDHLRIAQGKLTRAMDVGKLALWTMYASSNVMEFDDRKALMLGYTADEFKNKKFADMLSYIHEDDRESVLQSIQAHLIGVAPSYNVEYRIRRADGNFAWFNDRGEVTFRKTNGEPVQVTGMSIDISTQKETVVMLEKTEERLSGILNTIDDVVWSIDISSDMKIIYLSPAVKKVFGRTFEEFQQNKHLWMMSIHPDDRATMADSFMQLKSAGSFDSERRIILPDGSIRWVRDRGWNIYDPTGNVIRVDGIISDITKRKIAEEEHLKFEAQLRHSQKMDSIGELAAGIAHEINNPVGFVLGNSETIIEYVDSLKKYISIVEKELPGDDYTKEREDLDIDYITEDIGNLLKDNLSGLHRVKEIVSNLKDFARIDIAQFTEADMEDNIRKTLAIAKSELKYNIEVHLNFGKVSRVFCNPGEMNQVFLNIIINAAQAINEQKRTSKGNITVTTSEDDASVYCEIEDDGPGIPAEIQTRIFEPFFTTKDVGKGTGLGLSIAYDITVNKHNGTLTVNSEPGKGASFKIQLPKKQIVKDT